MRVACRIVDKLLILKVFGSTYIQSWLGSSLGLLIRLQHIYLSKCCNSKALGAPTAEKKAGVTSDTGAAWGVEPDLQRRGPRNRP